MNTRHIAIGLLMLSNMLAFRADAGIDSGLVARYRFEGNGNNAAGSGLTLTPTDATFGGGIAGGQAGVFSASFSRFETSANFPITGNTSRTISAWIYLESFLDKRRVVTLGNGAGNGNMFGIVVAADGGIVLTCNGREAYTETGIIKLNQWHHIAVVYSGSLSNTRFYVDGLPTKIASVVTDSDTLNTVSTPLFIGYDNLLPSVDWNRAWHGKIDEVRIYNRALSAAEVAFLAEIEDSPTTSLSKHKAIELRIAAKKGITYQLQSSKDQITWENDGTPIVGNDTLKRIFRSITSPATFYRVRKTASD